MKISRSKFSICFLCSVCICFFICSCHPIRYFTVNGVKDYYLTSECGDATLKCYYALRTLTIGHHFKGEYTLYPDSLKLGFAPDYMTVNNLWFCVDGKKVATDEVVNVKDSEVWIYFNGDFGTNPRKDSIKIFILPSNYIMCNDQPLIKDTICWSERNQKLTKE